MTRNRWITLGLALCLTAALGGTAIADDAATGHDYGIDRAHSSVTFAVRHFFNDVPGRFNDFTGKVVYDAENPEASSVEVVVQTTSIDTGMPKRDDHLRSPDFFDVENHPATTFRSTSVKAAGSNQLSVTGEFTMRGVTKTVTVPVDVLGVMELGGGKAKAGFRTRFTIDRKDYGVSWNRVLDQGGAILGDEVTIEITLQADRVVPDEAAATGP